MKPNPPERDKHEWTEDVRLTFKGTLEPVHAPGASAPHHHPHSRNGGRWLALFSSLLVMGLVVGLVLNSGNKGRGTREEKQVRLPPEDPVSQVRDARGAALGFVAAKDWHDALLWVLEPERVEPMMRDYYEHQRVALPGLASKLDEGKPERIGERLVCHFNLLTSAGRNLPLVAEWTSVGFRVDWLALSAYGTVAWPKLLAEKPEEPADLRLSLSRPAGDAPPGTDEGPPQWERFILRHRDYPEPLTAWVGDEHVLGRIKSMLGGREGAPVFLQVRFQDWNGHKIAVISALHHENWSL